MVLSLGDRAGRGQGKMGKGIESEIKREEKMRDRHRELKIQTEGYKTKAEPPR